MNEYPSYDSAARGDISDRARARSDLYIWLAASWCVGLAPFVFTALAYRMLYQVKHHYRFPSWAMLFGKGELLLIVLGVTAATIAELVLPPTHLTRSGKRVVFTIISFIAAAAICLFTTLSFESLAHPSERFDGNLIADLSMIMLFVVTLTQVITVLTRPTES